MPPRVGGFFYQPSGQVPDDAETVLAGACPVDAGRRITDFFDQHLREAEATQHN